MKRSQPIDYVKERQKELSMNNDVEIYEQNEKDFKKRRFEKRKTQQTK